MPNYYAHITLGARALERLDPALRLRLEGERPAFDLGCLGPDPLFFYRPALPNRVRREGMVMHARSALPVMERLRQVVSEERPMAWGYAGGFLCHLALDSACHGWIDQKAAEGTLTHLAMEAEFDRLLMERDGLPPLGRCYLPPVPGPQVFAAAALAYQATPAQIEAGYRSMWKTTAFFARLSGRQLSRPANFLAGRLPKLRALRGIFLAARPRAAFGESNAYLSQQWEATVEVAAQQLSRFFQAAARGGPLDPWLDRAFKGGSGHPAQAPQSAPAY